MPSSEALRPLELQRRCRLVALCWLPHHKLSLEEKLLETAVLSSDAIDLYVFIPNFGQHTLEVSTMRLAPAAFFFVSLLITTPLHPQSVPTAPSPVNSGNLIGSWRGLVQCNDIFLEFKFIADTILANGVSGQFSGSWNPGWLENTNFGSATLLEIPSSASEPARYVLSYTQRPDGFSTLRDTSSFTFYDMYGNSMHGEAVRENCQTVTMSLSQGTGE